MAEEEADDGLTEGQRLRMRENKARARQLLKQRVVARPAASSSHEDAPPVIAKKSKVEKIESMRDTGAGFFAIEEEVVGEPDYRPEIPRYEPFDHQIPLGDAETRCTTCEHPFKISYLLDKFAHPVCDSCHDRNKDDFALITKTTAKCNYLLQDAHFEREQPLKFIMKSNPHNPRWGSMKLFLECQVKERAVQVHGSEGAIEAEGRRRDERMCESRRKRLEKSVKQLRREVRSSTWSKDTSAAHHHHFGHETCVDSDQDLYTRTCLTCGYSDTYEKL